MVGVDSLCPDEITSNTTQIFCDLYDKVNIAYFDECAGYADTDSELYYGGRYAVPEYKQQGNVSTLIEKISLGYPDTKTFFKIPPFQPIRATLAVENPIDSVSTMTVY
ncbi:hypothetical protein LJC56_01430 [Christensenellaceae bacterium OttesenSCG-928-K19]|nr:hypothetical protein [Christensenellaceae bacterium OttesenSCG-928-K19]